MAGINPTDLGGSESPADQVKASVATVRALLEMGLLDPAALGLQIPAEPSSADVSLAGLVPGAPIRMADLRTKALAGLKPSTRRAYGSYLNFLVDGWPAAAPAEEKLYLGMGDRWAHEVLASDLEDALRWVETRALVSAEWRANRRRDVERIPRETKAAGAKYNAVGAWRRLFSVAVRDRHLAKGYDPAQEVKKPARTQGTRRPLEDDQIADLWSFVSGTGSDPELDSLLCKTIIVSGARREGLFNLTLGGLDFDRCTVRLDEKFDKIVEQPVPDWLVQELDAFARSRGAVGPSDSVFRSRGTSTKASRPITSRRLDYIFSRLQAAYPWADRAQVTAHTLRHHAIALVERNSSKAVSMRFARHEPGDVNDGYGRASEREVVRVVIALHGGAHPLVAPPAVKPPRPL